MKKIAEIIGAILGTSIGMGKTFILSVGVVYCYCAYAHKNFTWTSALIVFGVLASYTVCKIVFQLVRKNQKEREENGLF